MYKLYQSSSTSSSYSTAYDNCEEQECCFFFAFSPSTTSVVTGFVQRIFTVGVVVTRYRSLDSLLLCVVAD